MREREIDDRLVELRRYDDRAEICGVARERLGGAGMAGRRGQAERGTAEFEGSRVQIDQGNDFQQAIGRVGGEELRAPASPEGSDPDMDHALRHVPPPGRGR